MNSNKVGIIGGMGSRASSFFFNKLVDSSTAMIDQDFSEIFLHNNTRIPDRTLSILGKGISPIPELLRSLEIMQCLQVNIVVSVCVTSFHFISQILNEREFDFKVVDPVKLLSDFINLRGYSKVGILATTGTFSSGIFDSLSESGDTTLLRLNEIQQEKLFMRSLYMENGLKSSEVSNASIALFRKSVETLQHQDLELLVGGCTEVSVFIEKERLKVPYLDIMDLMVDEILNYCK